MYCLTVIIAHPDYKRPSTQVVVEHFKDEESANSRLNEIKLRYIENFIEDDNITIEEFDRLVESGKLCDIIYVDSYMHQPPFESRITKIQF